MTAVVDAYAGWSNTLVVGGGDRLIVRAAAAR